MDASAKAREMAVIIPTWNGLEMLRTCLASLKRQTYRDFQLYVVDNGSTDGTSETVGKEYPDGKVIRLDTNCGFSVAVNKGIRAGSEPLVLMLNNDVELEPGWLAVMAERAGTHPEESIWTGVLLWAHRPDLVESAGLSLFKDGTPAILYRTQPLSVLPGDAVRILGAYGGAALYRRRVLDQVGLLDERFVFYGEDMDLALRACLAGYPCTLVPSARGVHRHMATSSRRPNLSAYLQYRNIVFYLLKSIRMGLLWRWMPRFALTGFRPLLLSPWRGLGWALIGAKFGIMWNLPYVLSERRRVRAGRRVDDAELEKLFVEGRSRSTAEMRPPELK